MTPIKFCTAPLTSIFLCNGYRFVEEPVAVTMAREACLGSYQERLTFSGGAEKDDVILYGGVLPDHHFSRRACVVYSCQRESASTRYFITRVEHCWWNTQSTTTFVRDGCVFKPLPARKHRFRRSRDAHIHLTQVRGGFNYCIKKQ